MLVHCFSCLCLRTRYLVSVYAYLRISVREGIKALYGLLTRLHNHLPVTVTSCSPETLVVSLRCIWYYSCRVVFTSPD